MPESIPGTEGAQSITAVVRPRTILIKYGGNAMLDPQLVDGVLARLVAAHHGGMHVVLVHGGGPYIARRLEQQGLESRFIDGQRVTGADVMAVVSMVLCGEVNGRIVSDLQRLGAPAVGLAIQAAGLESPSGSAAGARKAILGSRWGAWRRSSKRSR